MYAHRNLKRLHLPEIPLTVPTYDDAIMINSPMLNDPRPLIVEVNRPGCELTIARADGYLLQVMEADDRKANYSEMLFREPIQQLGLRCLDRCTWLADVDERNINDLGMMREFVSILSNFAAGKQHRLIGE